VSAHRDKDVVQLTDGDIGMGCQGDLDVVVGSLVRVAAYAPDKHMELGKD
jgi:hypothetical protein